MNIFFTFNFYYNFTILLIPCAKQKIKRNGKINHKTKQTIPATKANNSLIIPITIANDLNIIPITLEKVLKIKLPNHSSKSIPFVFFSK